MARLALYLRRSSPGEDAKNYSLEDQQRDIETRWADFKQHTPIGVYKDPGGKSYSLNRPILQQLFTDAKARKFDIVVVARWDRFSRMQDQQAVAIYMLEQYGVRVVSATQPVSDGPLGTAQRNLYAFGAELELQNIRERTYGGKRSRVQSGKLPNQARPLYGYLFGDTDNPDSKQRRAYYIEDPETAPIVRRIHQMYYDGLAIRTIARKLTDEGVPTPTQVWESRGWLYKNTEASTLWWHSAISKILSNPAYIGKHVGFRTKRTSHTQINPITQEPEEYIAQRRRAGDDEERVEYGADVCPAIVDEAIFRANQDARTRNREQSSRNMREPAAALLRNGFAECGYCGHRVRVQFAKSAQRYIYRCGAVNLETKCPAPVWSWRTDDMDALVWGWFVAQFKNPELVRRKYEMWKADRVAGRSIERDELKATSDQIILAERRAKNAKASALDAETDEDRAEWTRITHEESRKARDLQVKYDELAAILGRDEQQELAVDAIVALGKAAIERLGTADFDTKRRTLYAFKVHVVLRSRHEPEDQRYEFSWGLDAVYDQWVREQLAVGQESFCVPIQS